MPEEDKCKKRVKAFKLSFYYGNFIRFFIEAFLELYLSSLLNLTELEFNTVAEIANSVTSVLIFFVINWFYL